MESNQVFNNFLKWAEISENLRMAILTSSRVEESNSKTDFLSDYDVELYVRDLDFFNQNDHWIEQFGAIMVRWPYKPRSTGDEGWITRLILFKEGTRIDFQITDRMKIEPKRYDNGYKVLIDKDEISNEIEIPTYTEFIIKKPSLEAYEALIHEFWWDAYYIPKYLWRDQLPFAKYMLDNILRYEFMHKMIDWYIGSANHWTVATGALGKYYKEMLPKEVWEEFEATYAGGGITENWEAFYRTLEFFRKMAKEVGLRLNYTYPENVDLEVTKFCDEIKSTPKD